MIRHHFSRSLQTRRVYYGVSKSVSFMVIDVAPAIPMNAHININLACALFQIVRAEPAFHKLPYDTWVPAKTKQLWATITQCQGYKRLCSTIRNQFHDLHQLQRIKFPNGNSLLRCFLSVWFLFTSYQIVLDRSTCVLLCQSGVFGGSL